MLVPVRNVAEYVQDWLQDVATFADAVVALDDGSTDCTRTLLEAHPLVTQVLTNPVRPGYEGWDDLANRQRLVHGALAGGARWLLFLDADERIDAEDAAALRRFLATEAQPGYAYGFEVFRMVDDHEHYDPRSLWVFRLFAAADAVSPLGSQRLHFVPVPSGIPMERWLYTSIRIQHAGSLTRERRHARFEKYREADPGNDFQMDYENLLDDPAVIERWPVRAPDLPVLLGTEGRYVDWLEEIDSGSGPVITAVVIAQDDEAVIDRSIGALAGQDLDEEFEVILVGSGGDGTVEQTRASAPTVRCVQLPERALPGEARNAGLWMARGEYITFPGSHVWLQPGSLAARLRAHDEGWELVTGSVVNGNVTRPGWASYFLDHSVQMPCRPSGEYGGVPGHVSYSVRDVREIGGFPEGMRAGEDTVVNRKLYFSGCRTYFAADAAFTHASPSTRVSSLLRHHFQRGRALGLIIRDGREDGEVFPWQWVLALPIRRMRVISDALREADEELRGRYREVRGLVVAGAVASATGTWTELARRNRPSADPVESRVTADDVGPVLAVGGRPGDAGYGLLAAGSPQQAAHRLQTFARYARSVGPVRPALAPIVTSATVSAEMDGTFTIDLPMGAVHAYLDAARGVHAGLLLQMQPGRGSLSTLVERWRPLLAEPDVGVLFDLRPSLATADQALELGAVMELIRAIGGDATPILVRGLSTLPRDAIAVRDALDLRRPGTPFPHDALRMTPRPEVLLYQ